MKLILYVTFVELISEYDNNVPLFLKPVDTLSHTKRFSFGIIYVISVLFLLCFPARLFIDALWSPAGKGRADLLTLVCDV